MSAAWIFFAVLPSTAGRGLEEEGVAGGGWWREGGKGGVQGGSDRHNLH